MDVEDQYLKVIPNFPPVGRATPQFFVIDKDWPSKDRGYGPFSTMIEASNAAVEYNNARARDTGKRTYSARVVRVDLTGRHKAVKVLNSAPRHQPIGNYSEAGGW